MVFGESGQGKSTTLNKIVECVALDNALGPNHGCSFKSESSFKSVTGCLKEGTIGKISLIDTPGLNDPNVERSDKNIIIEMIKNLQAKLNDPSQGISSLILCVLPDASQRIRETTIKAINNMFLMFTSLDERVDISAHPKYFVIFNNVSRYGDNYDPVRIKNEPGYDPFKDNPGLSKNQRINDIKLQIKDKAKRFYLSEKVSDETKIGAFSWKEIKAMVCEGDSYKEENWYEELLEH